MLMIFTCLKLFRFNLPMQQSADLAQLLPVDEKSFLQLLRPHLRFPAQWESLSQSPPPTLQGLEGEQHPQFVLGTPLHKPGCAGVVEVCVEGCVGRGVVEDCGGGTVGLTFSVTH